MMLPFTVQKDSLKIMLKIIRPNIIKGMILQSEQQIITRIAKCVNIYKQWNEKKTITLGQLMEHNKRNVF